MNNEYQLMKMNNFSIKDPEMIMKYASLGYFHYQYINSLDPLNSSENLVKDNGVIKGPRFNFKDGNYIEIAVADFDKRRKISCVFWYEKHRLRNSVGDLLDLLKYINGGLRLEGDNCFVKFDVYTIVS